MQATSSSRSLEPRPTSASAINPAKRLGEPQIHSAVLGEKKVESQLRLAGHELAGRLERREGFEQGRAIKRIRSGALASDLDGDDVEDLDGQIPAHGQLDGIGPLGAAKPRWDLISRRRLDC